MVDTDLLKRLIRMGAQPQDFEILRTVYHPQPAGATASPRVLSTARKPLMPADDASGRFNQIVVHEPDARRLKRLLRMLAICKVRLDSIRVVSNPAHLPRALQQGGVSALLMDSGLYPLRDTLPMMQSLIERHTLDQVILTVNPEQHDKPQQAVLKQAAGLFGVQLLFRPINPFEMLPMLQMYHMRRETIEALPFKERAGFARSA